MVECSFKGFLEALHSYFRDQSKGTAEARPPRPQGLPRGSKYPILEVFSFQKPYLSWFLVPGTLNIGYLDPLGYLLSAVSLPLAMEPRLSAPQEVKADSSRPGLGLVRRRLVDRQCPRPP